jgi:glycosyltransferase involved in cell wall biosynthesis
MNVVLVTSFLDLERGAGTAERTRHLAVHLADLGCKCSIIAMAGTAWLKEFKDAEIEVLLTGYIGDRFSIPVPRLMKIWRLVRGADVVHVMGYWYLLAALVSFMANFVGKPTALCPAGELTPGFRSAPWKKLYYRLFGRTMIANAASIIATTSREHDEIMTTENVAPGHIMISPNGIAPIGITGPSRVRPLERPFILFMGRLTVIKGPDLLVEAFAKISGSIPNIDLVIAGPDRGMRSALKAKVEALGLRGRVTLVGFVDEQTRQHLYRNAAFLVLPSRSEAMSMVALEAAAVGTPVLLTDRCGFDEVEEIGGGLVVSADVDGLAAGLAKMLDGREDLRLMGQRLRGFVLARYAWTNVALHLRNHLAYLAGRPVSPRGVMIGREP